MYFKHWALSWLHTRREEAIHPDLPGGLEFCLKFRWWDQLVYRRRKCTYIYMYMYGWLLYMTSCADSWWICAGIGRPSQFRILEQGPGRLCNWQYCCMNNFSFTLHKLTIIQNIYTCILPILCLKWYICLMRIPFFCGWSRLQLKILLFKAAFARDVCMYVQCTCTCVHVLAVRHISGHNLLWFGKVSTYESAAE